MASSCATRWTLRRSRWAGGRDPQYGKAAFYAYAYPAPDGWAGGGISPGAARWEERLGEYVLDWDDIVASPDPHSSALEFARSACQGQVEQACGHRMIIPGPGGG
jgi:hypothetical protein